MFEEILLEPSTSNLNAIRAKYELLPIIEENDLEKTEEESMVFYEEGNDDFQAEYIIEEEHLEDHLEEAAEKCNKPATKENIERLFLFKCHVCCEEFPKMQQLSTHCKSIHNETPLVECVCGKILSSWKRLMDHRARHLKDENEYKCTECKLSYKTQLAYQKHIEKKHGKYEVNKFVCTTCGRNFKDKQVLKNHEKTHLPDDQKLRFPCLQCDKKFINNHCRKIHIARVHEKISFFFCEHCGKGCTTKSDLLWHMDKHTQERNFECKICYLKFKSTNSLRIHQRRHEIVEVNKKCKICNKSFRTNAALSNHNLVHSDEKKYQCQFCTNSYKRLETYKCHLSTHTGVR
jgi:Zinc-finger double-stranded RNA-binding/Zinc finger, C2H2 type